MTESGDLYAVSQGKKKMGHKKGNIGAYEEVSASATVYANVNTAAVYDNVNTAAVYDNVNQNQHPHEVSNDNYKFILALFCTSTRSIIIQLYS